MERKRREKRLAQPMCKTVLVINVSIRSYLYTRGAKRKNYKEKTEETIKLEPKPKPKTEK